MEFAEIGNDQFHGLLSSPLRVISAGDEDAAFETRVAMGRRLRENSSLQFPARPSGTPHCATWDRWIVLNHGEWRDGSCNDAAGGHHRSLADNDSGQDQGAGTNECVASYGYALDVAEMREHGDPQTQDAVVFERDRERTRSIEHDVITDPNILADLDATLAMQPQRAGS